MSRHYSLIHFPKFIDNYIMKNKTETDIYFLYDKMSVHSFVVYSARHLMQYCNKVIVAQIRLRLKKREFNMTKKCKFGL